jgi:hypothetical protein
MEPAVPLQCLRKSAAGPYHRPCGSRDSSVVIAPRYGLDGRGFESRQELGIFLFTAVSRPALGPTLPTIQWVPGALSLWVKRPGREADHSPPSSNEVKNASSYTSIPQYTFIAWCSVKAQGQIYLYILPKPSESTLLPHTVPISVSFRTSDNIYHECSTSRLSYPPWLCHLNSTGLQVHFVV